jgi:hypothetical protein
MMKNEYRFQLGFKLKASEDARQYEDALYEAGCDDAVLGVGKKGYIRLEFIRESRNAVDALTSAIQNVYEAIPGAELIRAEPFLVNLSDLAFMFDCTKQNMSKYFRGELGSTIEGFPEPVIEGKTAYWYAIEVATWLSKNSKINVADTELEILSGLFSLNKAIDEKFEETPEVTASLSQIVKRVA